MQHIEFPSGRTTRSLFLMLGILVLLHLVVVFCHVVLHAKVEALTQLVDLDLESNLPTYFNSALFFIGAILFHLHGRTEAGKKRAGWYLMAAVFIFLGIDEGSQVHEKFMLFTHRLLNTGGIETADLGWFYYSWVIPYGLAAIGLLLLLSRWLFNLAPMLRWGMILSGATYLLGAVIMEMAGGKAAQATYYPPSDFPWLPCESYSDPGSCWLYMDPTYITLYTLEEVLEMTGLILAIHFLLRAIEDKGLTLSLALRPRN